MAKSSTFHTHAGHGSLAPEVAKDLAQRGSRRHFPAGDTIYAHGDPGTDLLIIATGQVEVSTVSHAGRKLVLGHLGPGDLLGELALLDQSQRSATAVAVSDVTGHSVGFDDFRAFLADFPDVHFALTVELCRKLRNANAMLEDQTQKDGATRLARSILRLADKFGQTSDETIVIPMTLSQSEIGDLSGLTRANVNRYLRAWMDEGLIHFEKGRVTVTNPQGLVDLATS